ncbi:sugar ABC transporter substrate-binding protein [Ectothiorhodospiraceae bacterium BW-2]|nr:sugar ABC transporter substrate-binding protein [Ectothiorhodospiraceae bacterium BW-2]
MRTTIRLALAPLLLPLLLLVSCGESNSPTLTTTESHPPQASPQQPESRPQIALVMKTLTNPFFVAMEQGARRAERELTIQLHVKTAAQETSIEQQIQIVLDLIQQQIDAIVIAPGDSQRLIPVLKQAADQGVVIVNIDNRLDAAQIAASGMAPIPFISVDNQQAAYQSAKYIADQVTEPTQAAILEGIRSANNAHQRMLGAKRAFADNPLVSLVASESANWKIDEGYEVTKRLFADHPEIKLLFAANDMMALGAITWLQESGLTEVKVAAYDALEEAITEIRQGRLAATVDQQAAEQGYQGIKLAVQRLQGEPVANEVMIETRLLTSHTLP